MTTDNFSLPSHSYYSDWRRWRKSACCVSGGAFGLERIAPPARLAGPRRCRRLWAWKRRTRPSWCCAWAQQLRLPFLYWSASNTGLENSRGTASSTHFGIPLSQDEKTEFCAWLNVRWTKFFTKIVNIVEMNANAYIYLSIKLNGANFFISSNLNMKLHFAQRNISQSVTFTRPDGIEFLSGVI